MTTQTRQINLTQRKVVSGIGMTVLLVSFAMLFASLLLGYIIFRLSNEVWPPMGMEVVPLTLPTVSTFIIAVSSLLFHNMQTAYEGKIMGKAKMSYILTFALGCLFMYAQFKLWQQMGDIGLYVSGGVFPSLMYTLTWVHAAHIVMGLLALLLLVPTILMSGLYSDEKMVWIINIGKFWHFLGIVWLIMYFVMFVF